MTDPAFDLPGLRRQFAESVETLGGLEERLRSIALSDEAIGETSQSLTEAGAAITGASTALEGITQALRATTQLHVDGLDRIDRFLQQTDMAALDNRLDLMSSTIDARLTALEEIFNGDLAAAKSEVERLAAALEAARTAMSSRQLKKLDEA